MSQNCRMYYLETSRESIKEVLQPFSNNQYKKKMTVSYEAGEGKGKKKLSDWLEEQELEDETNE